MKYLVKSSHEITRNLFFIKFIIEKMGMVQIITAINGEYVVDETKYVLVA
jgi:hypothetical protein